MGIQLPILSYRMHIHCRLSPLRKVILFLTFEKQSYKTMWCYPLDQLEAKSSFSIRKDFGLGKYIELKKLFVNVGILMLLGLY